MTTAARDTRQVIVVAAADLFRKQGYAATTMQHVAAATGMSKGNLTYHFPSKRALFEEVHRQALAFVRDHYLRRSFAEAGHVVAGTEAFLRRLRRVLVDDDGHFVGCLFTNIAIEVQHAEPEVAALARAALGELRACFAAEVVKGQARGEVRSELPADNIAQGFFWAYEGALTMARAMNDPAEFDAFRALWPSRLAPPA